MKNIFISFFLFTTLFCACTGSSKPSSKGIVFEAKEKKKVCLNMGDEPHSLDPRKVRDLNSVNVLRMLFDGLTRINLEEKPELSLAERMKVSNDFKTYTFYLRQAEWSDGTPIKASDFAYAWKKVLDPQFSSSNAFLMYVIKNAKEAKEGKVSLDEVGIYVLDEHTLKIELEQITPYFLELLSHPVFFPVAQAVDERNPHWAEEANSYVSNGPFSLKEWKHHDQLELEKSDSYWDASKVKIENIQLVMVEADTAYRMFEKRELDWAGSPISVLPLDTLKFLKQENRLEAKPFLATAFIRVNVTKAPFQQSSLRKAFAFAINRKDIVEHVLQGGQEPAIGLVPSTMGLQSLPYFSDSNIHGAQELMAKWMKEEKIEKEQFPEVTLTFLSNERNRLVAQAVQQQWFEALGVRVKLEGVESKVFFDRISKQDFQLALGSWTADFNDPVNFLEVFKYRKNGTNNTCWEHPEYIRGLDLAAIIPNEGKRKEMLSFCEKVLIDEMPIIPLYHFTLLFAKNNQLNNVVVSSLGGLDFKWASFQSPDQKITQAHP
jgi:oligopeptide transport system substrate-binding protein